MEPFDVTVALGMVVGGASVRDAQPIQGFDITGGRKLRAVVGRQSQTRSTRTERQNLNLRRIFPGCRTSGSRFHACAIFCSLNQIPLEIRFLEAISR